MSCIHLYFPVSGISQHLATFLIPFLCAEHKMESATNVVLEALRKQHHFFAIVEGRENGAWKELAI